MHIIISRSGLLKALTPYGNIVERKNTIPILGNVLLETQPKTGELIISGTDLDLGLTSIIPTTETRASGAICIQFKKLFEIVRALPDADVEIKVEDDVQIKIACLKTRYKMTGLKKENFPNIKTPAQAPWRSLPAATLALMIQRTQFAITTEESRYALNGARFEWDDKGLRMIATDGHRLAFIGDDSLALSEGENLGLLIPKKTLTALAAQLAELGEGSQVEFAGGNEGEDANHIWFRAGNRTLQSKRLTGQFPNYELVLPKNNQHVVKIESATFAATLGRVAKMADEKSHSVKLELTRHNLEFSAQATDIGDAQDEITVEYTGPDITIGFNAQYLLDFPANTQNANLQMEFKDGASQIQMRVQGGGIDNRYIVMPLRV